MGAPRMGLAPRWESPPIRSRLRPIRPIRLNPPNPDQTDPTRPAPSSTNGHLDSPRLHRRREVMSQPAPWAGRDGQEWFAARMRRVRTVDGRCGSFPPTVGGVRPGSRRRGPSRQPAVGARAASNRGAASTKDCAVDGLGNRWAGQSRGWAIGGLGNRWAGQSVGCVGEGLGNGWAGQSVGCVGEGLGNGWAGQWMGWNGGRAGAAVSASRIVPGIPGR